MLKGFDASSVQGIIPFETLSPELRFGIFKAQQGNDGFDPYFWRNVKACMDSGRVPGAYFFAYPLPHLDPREQARIFYDRSNGFGTNRGELPPFIDLEWPEVVPSKAGGKGWKEWGCSPQQISDWSEAHLDEVTKLWGHKPYLYTYEWWWNCLRLGAPAYGFPKGADVSWAAKYELWIPRYINRWPEPGWKAKLVPPFTRAPFVQIDGNGGMRLQNGVDSDFCIFDGTEEELRAIADGPSLREADEWRPVYVIPDPPSHEPDFE